MSVAEEEKKRERQALCSPSRQHKHDGRTRQGQGSGSSGSPCPSFPTGNEASEATDRHTDDPADAIIIGQASTGLHLATAFQAPSLAQSTKLPEAPSL